METNNKCREALEKVKKLFDGRLMFQPAIREAHEAVNAALAEPVKNCEVGTADEQSSRFDDFCFAHKTRERGCGYCPLVESFCCEFAWSQMPYPEGVNNV